MSCVAAYFIYSRYVSSDLIRSLLGLSLPLLLSTRKTVTIWFREYSFGAHQCVWKLLMLRSVGVLLQSNLIYRV